MYDSVLRKTDIEIERLKDRERKTEKIFIDRNGTEEGKISICHFIGKMKMQFSYWVRKTEAAQDISV